MFTLDRASPVALADQIEARLRELIDRGQVPAGARLASIPRRDAACSARFMRP